MHRSIRKASSTPIPDRLRPPVKPWVARQETDKNKAALRLEICSPEIVKLRYAHDGRFENEFSYAMDSKFKPSETAILVVESEEKIELQIGDLGVQVIREGLLVRFFDLFSGRTFCEDDAPFFSKQTIQKGFCEVKISKKAGRKEAFFGLGDKTCGVNLRGKKYSNWCADSFAFRAPTRGRSVDMRMGRIEGTPRAAFLALLSSAFFVRSPPPPPPA